MIERFSCDLYLANKIPETTPNNCYIYKSAIELSSNIRYVMIHFCAKHSNEIAHEIAMKKSHFYVAMKILVDGGKY